MNRIRKSRQPKGERQKVLEQDPVFGEPGGGETGRAGGNLQRKVASRDTLKRAFERPAPVTRVRKSDEAGKQES